MSGVASGITLASVASAATIAGGIASVAGALGVFGGAPKPASLPAVVAPAQAATTNRNDTGGQVVVGADAVKNQRVSGNATAGGTQARSTSTTDILGGLGAGGINI